MTLPGRPDDELRAHVERVLSTNYEVDSELGRGGMGIVYRARDKRLKRPVAVKLLPPELAYRQDIRSRFLREAQTAAQLNHPNIVPIYTVEEVDNLVFFIMGYVDGGNLASRLQREGAMPPDEARRVLREVADALAFAHARKVIHRDIKPDNILLSAEDGRAIVTDFGIARAVTDTTDTRLTTTGVAIGTPAFMSPEQSAGDRDVDGRSDLYSLGVVGYQMLCGELPFVAANTPSMLVKHLSETPRPLDERCPGVPPDLTDAIMRCLEKNPADRFPDAAGLVAALDGRDVPSLRPTVARPAANRDYSRSAPAATTPARSEADGRSPVVHEAPTIEEMSRWEAEPVQRFRRKLIPFLMANAVLVPVGIFSEHGLFGVTVIWSVVMAMKYSKLWQAGYDWRDVFRQPRDRLLVDVVGETIDETKALFDPHQREQLRARMRGRQDSRRPSIFTPPSPPLPPLPGARRPGSAAVTGMMPPITPEYGAHLPAVQQAVLDRNEVHRLMAGLSKTDREMLPDVNASADALYARIELLAATADELERVDVPGMGDAVEREIAQLEAEANPLDEERSERRVRRLAQLRRQKVSMREVATQRREVARKLDSCRAALSSMRVDLLRLSTGAKSYESVTLLAEQAMQLGNEVDAVMYAHSEIARVMRRSS